MTKPPESRPIQLTRRHFLRDSGATLVAGAVIGAACNSTPTEHGPNAGIEDHIHSSGAFADAVPATPIEPLTHDAWYFFTADEAATVDALASRIIPGDAGDPGAHEAGAVVYIDLKLGTAPGGFATPIYHRPPFAKAIDGEPPKEAANDRSRIAVAKDELDRYGFQSSSTYREIFRSGIAALDGWSKKSAGAPFRDLDDASRDRVIGTLLDGTAEGFSEPTAKLFFKTVRSHVLEGFFCDPVYGGNQKMVGWKLVGYPGAQRAYTPADLRGETPLRAAQSLTELHPFHAGHATGPNAVLPVSGSGRKGDG